MKQLSVMTILAILATLFGANAAKALENSSVSVNENLMSSQGQSAQLLAQMEDDEDEDEDMDDDEDMEDDEDMDDDEYDEEEDM